jgi:hypothetical protein
MVVGCTGGRKLQQYTELSGTVKFEGVPLHGGQIVFHGKEGEADKTAVIHEDGTYSISAPVGECKIGVDNSMLKPGAQGKEKRPKGMKMGAGPKPGMGEQTEIKGTYVDIPAKYHDPQTSGLDYTVKKGDTKHDIDLTK